MKKLTVKQWQLSIVWALFIPDRGLIESRIVLSVFREEKDNGRHPLRVGLSLSVPASLSAAPSLGCWFTCNGFSLFNCLYLSNDDCPETIHLKRVDSAFIANTTKYYAV